MVPLLRGVEELVTQDVGKTEVPVLFASFSLVRFALRPRRSPRPLTVCGSKAIGEGGVTDHLRRKSTGLGWAAPRSTDGAS